MKYHLFFLVSIAFTLTLRAQSNIAPRYNQQQKKFLDSLRNAYKQPAILINPNSQLVYNTPTVLLPNEGEKWGMSGQDTIYKMKTDNMRVLKPNTNTTAIPNATEEKMFSIPPAKKKP